MKVLYFHQHFSTPKGSAGIRSYQMARNLIRNGHQVTMVCGSYGGGNTGLGTP
ncbi:MAG TPA: glycosyltransferase WbuB, partial [Idiomarina loihiensis]|nr:glycosyltransferase WbuB [Idiomarina loihiensis]